MAAPPSLLDLLAPYDPAAIKAAIEAAYALGKSEGLVEGQAAERGRIKQLLEGAPPTFVSPPRVIQQELEIPRGSPAPAKRAPKGLTQQIVDLIIESQPGLTAKEIAHQAVLLDGRISSKTVYNTLLGQDRYIQRGEGWHFANVGIPAIGGSEEMQRREGDG
ncbi:MAG: hypothetical protein ACK4RV_13850 [Caulobacter sp.]